MEFAGEFGERDCPNGQLEKGVKQDLCFNSKIRAPHRMLKLALFLLTLAAAAQADPVHLRTNALENPLGIDTPHPTFSAQSYVRTPNWMQSAYEVLVATDAKNLSPGKADAWDSGRISSSESVNIAYAGSAGSG